MNSPVLIDKCAATTLDLEKLQYFLFSVCCKYTDSVLSKDYANQYQYCREDSFDWLVRQCINDPANLEMIDLLRKSIDEFVAWNPQHATVFINCFMIDAQATIAENEWYELMYNFRLIRQWIKTNFNI